MSNSPTEVRTYRFTPLGLDPVFVYVEQYKPTAGRIIVQCYAQAWTAYWGAHGNDGLESFFASCNNEYLADNLLWGWGGAMLKNREKSNRAYLIRIIEAIKSEFAKEPQ